MKSFLVVGVTLVALVALVTLKKTPQVNPLLQTDDASCFCQLKGLIDDCQCNIDTVDYFNNKKIYPRLQSLLQKNYFKYFQYNTHKPCPFWDTSLDKCSSTSCGVKSCSRDELPPGLQEPIVLKDCHDDLVDPTISDSVKHDLKSWQSHDENKLDFCDVHAETCVGCDYIDLTINPERYTGYAGEPSLRIWRAIYEENCFKPSGSGPIGAAFLQDALEKMCLEKRVFYRAVSGLHASITIHLTAMFALSKMDPESRATALPFTPQLKQQQQQQTQGLPFTTTAPEVYGPNLKEFLKRFDPELTNGQGPYWLRNLYFVYLLELRALTKAAPYLEKHSFYTGDIEEDIDTLIAIKELFALFRSFPDQFDESSMFTGGLMASQLKIEFRDHFRNITSIMDCVGCEKCKLWGKLQTTGLGTALKILISDSEVNLNLTRNEIVALFNAFGRISTSIFQLERFRAMIKVNSPKEEL